MLNLPAERIPPFPSAADSSILRQTMRKKQLLALLAMILAGVVAMLVVGIHKGPSGPSVSVATIYRETTADPIIQIDSLHKTSGDIQGNRNPILNRLSHALRHKPLYQTVDKFLLHSGGDKVWVILFSENDLVNSIEIHPLSPPSKLAERLRADLTAAHPGLPCSIKKP